MSVKRRRKLWLGVRVAPAAANFFDSQLEAGQRPHIGYRFATTSALAETNKNKASLRLAPPNQGGSDIEQWLNRLELILPAELRRYNTITGQDTDLLNSIKPVDVANLLSEARRLRQHDLLLALAQSHRWRELVWLVTYLIDDLWQGNPINSWTVPSSPLSSKTPLEDFIRNPSDLAVGQFASKPRAFRPLDQALLGDHPLSKGAARRQYTGHQLLGEIWQSLGNMILEDKQHGQNVQPGILEIIAVLHSRNVMPDAIYNYSPSQSSAPGSQPPTLHLLSSQIMTTLSDAVWRAREATAVELAHKRGRPAVFMGPELPSSNYRVRVAGIRHEIWLELVLWSCLHGGWVRPGSAILDEVMKQRKPSWSPISWRETMEPLVKVGQETSIDWDRVGYKLGAGQHEDDSDATIQNTISSEVLSAYVDGLINHISVGVGGRGMQAGYVIGLLSRTKKFLTKHRFSLEANSWDAIIQRIVESESMDVEEATSLTERLLRLSSTYGEEKSARNAPTRDEAWRPLAPYLVDGSAITLGLTHRILKAYIDRGNFAAAFYAFQDLQTRTDENKKQSIAAFFREIRNTTPKTDSTAVDFQSPYSQAFPAFYTMLPVSILAPFLDLVTEVGAYDFGKWLLASHDVDGPVIGAKTYRHPEMAPAIIRFLAASKNEKLLGQMLQRLQTDPEANALPTSVFIAIVESQLRLGNAGAAITAIDGLLRSEKITAQESEHVIALLAREALKEGSFDSGQTQIRTKLLTILTEDALVQSQVRLSNTIPLIVANVSMKKLCLEAIPLPSVVNFGLSTKSFNAILEGCASANGSSAARDLVCRFSRIANNVSSEDVKIEEDAPGILRVIGRIRPGSMHIPQDDVVDFYVSTITESDSMTQPEEVHVTGRFRPDVSSVRIVLVQRLQELRQDDEFSDHDGGLAHIGFGDSIVEWCAAMFKALGMQSRDIQQEIEGSYKDLGVQMVE
ncbi:Hypothetical protein D9617_6g094220 [Elsinoe fawcettii]|nr:Hypothetical protein D9617_6g094220 [Elsinoe fawcettii]